MIESSFSIIRTYSIVNTGHSIFLLFFSLAVLCLFSCTIDPNDAANNDSDGDDDDTGEGMGELRWIPIPGGTFEMGCSPDDSGCFDDEKPRHTVTISSFHMTETEITQQQYKEITGETPSLFTGQENLPVERVHWYNADDFCKEIGGRLPTEAEWEYAARAGTTTKYYCGNDPFCLDDIAWYYNNSDSQPHPVGGKIPNAWGLYDMTGNVWEWCSNWYDANFYDSGSSLNPQGPDNGEERISRGGTWTSISSHLRISHRSRVDPGFKGNGFRCARDK